MKKLTAAFALLFLASCVSTGRPERHGNFPDAASIQRGVWFNNPEPTEAQFIEHGYRGLRVWELQQTSWAALRRPMVRSWAITFNDGYVQTHDMSVIAVQVGTFDARPKPLPAWAGWADVISSFLIGVEAYPHEAELRRIHAQRSTRLIDKLRQVLHWDNDAAGTEH